MGIKRSLVLQENYSTILWRNTSFIYFAGRLLNESVGEGNEIVASHYLL